MLGARETHLGASTPVLWALSVACVIGWIACVPVQEMGGPSMSIVSSPRFIHFRVTFVSGGTSASTRFDRQAYDCSMASAARRSLADGVLIAAWLPASIGVQPTGDQCHPR